MVSAHNFRLLVAIASFGQKNIDFLRRIISEYRRMAMHVDVVVHSDAPKQLAGEAKVAVGLPTANPHSLPFAHKRLFADSVDKYDLFVYSEDDIGVKERNLRAFLRITALLEPDEIAGYLRYELDRIGNVYLPDVHGPFHWKPESVRRRGDSIIAEFTNEHAGFYVLTQAQLRRVLASGGYLREPCEGRYSMLETAATDPYACCGFRKVICITELDDFLIHHLSDRYAGSIGLLMTCFKEQLETLLNIQRGQHPVSTLCDVEPSVLNRKWYKSYHESPYEEVLTLVPVSARNILSVGCGWGATEAALQYRGSRVTAVPLDSVIGTSPGKRGIEVVAGTLDECARKLSRRRFDCVLLTNLLHLLPNPWQVLQEYSTLVENGGALVISGYNFDFLPDLARRVFGGGDYRKLRAFRESGINIHNVATVRQQLEHAGFRVTLLRWFDHARPRRINKLHPWFQRFMTRNWIIQARAF